MVTIGPDASWEEALFETWDVNRDGVLDRNEFQRGVASMSPTNQRGSLPPSSHLPASPRSNSNAAGISDELRVRLEKVKNDRLMLKSGGQESSTEVLAYFKHAMRVNVKLLAEATRRNERKGYTTPPPHHLTSTPLGEEEGPASSSNVGSSAHSETRSNLPVGTPEEGGGGASGKRSLLSRRVQAKSGGGDGQSSWAPPPGTITL